MSIPAIHPARDWVTCVVHEPPIPSPILLSAPSSPLREVTLTALGPDCRGVSVGQRLLVNTLAGVRMGDTLLLPQASLIAEVGE